MDSPDIIEVTIKVVRVFEKLGIDYLVGGSFASSAFGIARSTLDIDMVADIKLKHSHQIEKHLKEEFHVDIGMVRDAIRRQSTFNLIHLKTLFKVDIFVLKDRPFDRQSFSRRIKRSVTEEVSQQLFFATPEDTILNKLEWYRIGGEISDRQWTDILGILKVQGTKLNLSYLDKWADKLGLSDLLKKSLSDAGLDATKLS